MSGLPDSTDRRLHQLVDPGLYRDDSYYHAVISQFRSWLQSAQMAMEDEEVDAEVIECVLNRMVYGHPSGAQAYERMEAQQMMKDAITYAPQPRFIIPDTKRQV